jgi:PAS domain S-box-containing protein
MVREALSVKTPASGSGDNPAWPGSATILIVDDGKANRDLLVTLLRHEGHETLEAADGREGLAVARTAHPDLVITDVLMPVMDGYEFVKELRLDPATRDIPVVFYTDHYGQRDAKALALSIGVFEVLSKPVTLAEVLNVVSRVLSGTGTTADAAPLAPEFDRDHLRLVSDRLSEKVGDLQAANARLRALISIGVDLASDGDSDQRLQGVCVSASELVGATYATIAIVDRNLRAVTCLTSDQSDTSAWIAPGDAVPGILGRTVSERRTFRGNNPGGDPATLGLPSRHPRIQEFLSAAITSSARAHGWICLVNNDGRPFTEDDEHLIAALAAQVGRLYDLEHEIHERQLVEEHLRASLKDASNLRYAIDAHATVATTDPHGIITFVNDKFCEVSGYSREELLGRDHRLINSGHHSTEFIRDLWITIKQGTVWQGDLKNRAKNGTYYWVATTIVPFLNDDATPRQYLAIRAVITPRKEAELALQVAEERMRFALEAAKVGIWDMDYTTGSNIWSDAMQAQYGFEPGTFAGTFDAFVERVHPDDRESMLETIGRAMKSGTDFSVENRALWPDGTVRWLSGVGRMQLGEDGKPVRAVGISLDITEHRALEDQFRQAQKMEAVGRLAGGVAHDFNNLLTAILGYSELLLTGADPTDPRRADIEEIQKAGQSAARLTQQLLAFSRKQIIEPTLLDLSAVVADTRAMLERLIGEDVRVVVSGDSSLGLVMVDRGQVEQVVMNLAVNARDAMPMGGTLTIETANVELDEQYAKTHLGANPGSHVVLTVSDTGIGMSPDVQARLFEPFFTTKELGKGTGLGLATVHGIVTRAGGSVDVYSEVGRGTSFKVYLPRAKTPEPVVEAPTTAVRAHVGAETVLVVEDAEELRELTRRLLEQLGYTVLVAATAEEALIEFDRSPSIDVLLTDVVMPGASGPELTRRLVERRASLKVLYMSGYTEEAIVHHGVLNPGIAFLHKPFTSETLGRKLREVLDRAGPASTMR